jgi:hypothetical protein
MVTFRRNILRVSSGMNKVCFYDKLAPTDEFTQRKYLKVYDNPHRRENLKSRRLFPFYCSPYEGMGKGELNCQVMYYYVILRCLQAQFRKKFFSSERN